MKPRSLALFLASYVAILGVVCAAVRWTTSLHPPVHPEVLASVWKGGSLVVRVVLPNESARDPQIDDALREPGSELVLETVVAESPVVTSSPYLLGISLVTARDGVRATLGDKTAYVTPDDLLSRQVYDHGLRIEPLQLSLGLDTAALADLVADRLDTNHDSIFGRASLTRIRVERHTQVERPRITPDTLTAADVKSAVVDAAHYLAGGVSESGRFRYLVDATTNEEEPGYDWPRHAGATFFLAQTAGLTHDEGLARAARSAAALLRGGALGSCGGLPCVGDQPIVDLGSSALAVLAFSEIVERGLDPSYREVVANMARFLRAQQRPDGEFMHEYDRAAARPIDHQGLYYSSEATLALARAYAVTQDKADLDAAVRGLRNIVGPAWSFFGNRYYFGEEHWTCQAMATLWPYAPDPAALDFCVRWQEYGRAVQQHDGDSYFDADGAMGVGPVVTPRLTPVASRCEAAVATLDVARKGGKVRADEVAKIDEQLRRALALLLRQQFRPGPRHLFKNPGAVYGAMPGSEADWALRIDYVQHAGSAMIRWLEVNGRQAAP